MRFRVWLSALGLAPVLSMPARSQQPQMLDEGTFTLSVNGVRAGREVFSIKRNPAAAGFNIIGGATVTLGNRRLSPQLTSDTTGQFVSYGLEIRVNDRIVTQLRGDVVGGHYTQQNAAPGGGQSHRELRLAPGTVILDDDVVYQFYFLARRTSAGRVPVYDPQRIAQSTVTITVRGTEPVNVATGTVPGATHLIVTDAAGTVTDLWVDAARRVLRVEVPSRHFIAERDEAPR